MREPLHKNPHALKKWPTVGLQYVCSVEEFILEQENKNTAQKTERDVRLLERPMNTLANLTSQPLNFASKCNWQL